MVSQSMNFLKNLISLQWQSDIGWKMEHKGEKAVEEKFLVKNKNYSL